MTPLVVPEQGCSVRYRALLLDDDEDDDDDDDDDDVLTLVLSDGNHLYPLPSAWSFGPLMKCFFKLM